VAALLRRDLLEDAALEFMACGSPSVGRRSGGALRCLSGSLTSVRSDLLCALHTQCFSRPYSCVCVCVSAGVSYKLDAALCICFAVYGRY
jgi:hypothetical protein